MKMEPNGRSNWIRANRDLVAKAVAELTHEQVLAPELRGDTFELRLASGAHYRFRAWRTAWEFLRVDPTTVLRNGEDCESAARFFLDAREELGMADLVLANFLEEMQSTLYSEARRLELAGAWTVGELAEWPDTKLQSLLSGHPKILLNKGRLGFGANDLEHYAPESGPSFRLVWITVRRDQAVASPEMISRAEALLEESFDAKEMERFRSTCNAIFEMRGIRRAEYFFLPVHPWQWDRIVRIQYADSIARNELVALGEFGDHYHPQTSLRTLTNVSRPGRLDIKLPLSILNTSAIRGLPLRSLASGPELSRALARLCRQDELLNARGVEVLEEVASIGFAQPDYAELSGAAYRYHEQLGAIWRRTAELPWAEQSGEKSVLTGALFHQDLSGRSLLGEYIRRSGLPAAEWLRAYFRATVVPLYHLQIAYGVGLVAHGQNVILRMKDFRPCGMTLKDFQGDLRISRTANPRRSHFLGPFEGDLSTLPPEHLIHDLVTGHFLTVLRFVSATLQECESFPECEFYRLLREAITGYLAEYPPTSPLIGNQDLLGKTIDRVLLNSVRFRIGYADSNARPLPLLGTALPNPLLLTEALR